MARRNEKVTLICSNFNTTSAKISQPALITKQRGQGGGWKKTARECLEQSWTAGLSLHSLLGHSQYSR